MQRIVGGWSELLDQARDVGRALPAVATRGEQGRFLGATGEALARRADDHVFGASTPTDADAQQYWTQVEIARAALLKPLSRPQRWRAQLSTTSLKSSTRSATP